jgi:hypothetical protein
VHLCESSFYPNATEPPTGVHLGGAPRFGTEQAAAAPRRGLAVADGRRSACSIWLAELGQHAAKESGMAVDVDMACRNIVPMLQADVIRYRRFGVYWWA